MVIPVADAAVWRCVWAALVPETVWRSQRVGVVSFGSRRVLSWRPATGRPAAARGAPAKGDYGQAPTGDARSSATSRRSWRCCA